MKSPLNQTAFIWIFSFEFRSLPETLILECKLWMYKLLTNKFNNKGLMNFFAKVLLCHRLIFRQNFCESCDRKWVYSSQVSNKMLADEMCSHIIQILIPETALSIYWRLGNHIQQQQVILSIKPRCKFCGFFYCISNIIYAHTILTS